MSRSTVLHLAKIAGIAGAETHLLSLLPGLRERGWPVRMLMLHEREPGAFEFARELRGRGVPVDTVRLRADVDPIAFLRIAAYLARRRPLLLHTHLVHGDAYGQLAGAAAVVPVRFSTKHGFNEFRESRAFALADRIVASLADVHVAASAGLARYLADTEGFAREDFEIVHYGIRPGPPPEPYAGPPRVLCVGRLIPIKGHLVLLRALAAAAQRVPDLELSIAGRGPLDAPLAEVVDELGLAERVLFLGHVTPVQGALEDALAAVVPSLGEGFGMVALEAMERARPVIASAVGGLVDIVLDGETGVLVPPGEVEPLADAIVGLARDPALAARFGQAGRERVLAVFTEERPIEVTELLYRRALGGR